MPDGARSYACGVAVQQHHRLSLAAVAHPQCHVADVDILEREPLKHQLLLPRHDSYRGALADQAAWTPLGSTGPCQWLFSWDVTITIQVFLKRSIPPFTKS